jgi:hypothetical protein
VGTSQASSRFTGRLGGRRDRFTSHDLFPPFLFFFLGVLGVCARRCMDCFGLRRRCERDVLPHDPSEQTMLYPSATSETSGEGGRLFTERALPIVCALFLSSPAFLLKRIHGQRIESIHARGDISTLFPSPKPRKAPDVSDAYHNIRGPSIRKRPEESPKAASVDRWPRCMNVACHTYMSPAFWAARSVRPPTPLPPSPHVQSLPRGQHPVDSSGAGPCSAPASHCIDESRDHHPSRVLHSFRGPFGPRDGEEPRREPGRGSARASEVFVQATSVLDCCGRCCRGGCARCSPARLLHRDQAQEQHEH